MTSIGTAKDDTSLLLWREVTSARADQATIAVTNLLRRLDNSTLRGTIAEIDTIQIAQRAVIDAKDPTDDEGYRRLESLTNELGTWCEAIEKSHQERNDPPFSYRNAFHRSSESRGLLSPQDLSREYPVSHVSILHEAVDHARLTETYWSRGLRVRKSGGAWLTVAELDYLRKDPVRYLLNRGVTRFLEDTAQWTNPSNVYLSGEAAAYQSALDDATQAYLSEEPQESEQWPDALTELSKVVHEIERFSEKCAKTYGRMLFRQITEDPSDMLDGDVPSGTQGGSTFVNVDDTD